MVLEICHDEGMCIIYGSNKRAFCESSTTILESFYMFFFHETRRAMAQSPLFCCNFVHFVAWIFCLEIKIANTLQIKFNISIVLII